LSGLSVKAGVFDGESFANMTIHKKYPDSLASSDHDFKVRAIRLEISIREYKVASANRPFDGLYADSAGEYIFAYAANDTMTVETLPFDLNRHIVQKISGQAADFSTLELTAARWQIKIMPSNGLRWYYPATSIGMNGIRLFNLDGRAI
jgi:hypothetical protein